MGWIIRFQSRDSNKHRGLLPSRAFCHCYDCSVHRAMLTSNRGVARQGQGLERLVALLQRSNAYPLRVQCHAKDVQPRLRYSMPRKLSCICIAWAAGLQSTRDVLVASPGAQGAAAPGRRRSLAFPQRLGPINAGHTAATCRSRTLAPLGSLHADTATLLLNRRPTAIGS